jgi:hypothetical protein
MGMGMKVQIRRGVAAVLAAALLVASGAAFGNRSVSAQSTSSAPAISALTVCPVAGIGRTFEAGPASDGPAAGARISQPSSVAVTTALAAPQIFVVEGAINLRRIRKIDTATGQVTTVAGRDEFVNPGAESVPATSVFLNLPIGLAVAPDGSALYFAESGGSVIRKVDLATGILTTVVGQYGVATPVVTDGPARSVTLGRPTSLTLDGTSLSWTDGGRQIVQTLDLTTGQVTKIAGGGNVAQTDPAYRTAPGVLALSADLNEPNDVTALPGGLLITTALGRIYRYTTATGRLLLDAGSDAFSFNNDDGDGGPATSAHLGLPLSVAVVGTRTVIASGASNRLRVSDGITINAFAGAREMAYVDDSSGVAARFAFPMDIAADQFGAVYVADSQNNRVRKVSPLNVVTTLAGTGPVIGRYTAPVPAASAQFVSIEGVARGQDGTTYVSDNITGRIYAVSPAGLVTIVAGDGGFRYYLEPYVDNEPALSHRFGGAGYLGNQNFGTTGPLRYQVIGGQQYLYTIEGFSFDTGLRLVRIALDQPGRPVQSIIGTGIEFVPPVAGTVAATQPIMLSDFDVAPNGDVFIAPSFDPRVVKVSGATGIVSVFAGSAAPGDYSIGGVGGAATAAKVGSVRNITVAADGTVYWASSPANGGFAEGEQLFKVGGDGTLRLVAGTGGNSDLTFPADGLAAHIADSHAMTADGAGNVLTTEGPFIRRTSGTTSASARIVGPTVTPQTGDPSGALSTDMPFTGQLDGIDIGADGRIVFVDDFRLGLATIQDIVPFPGNNLVRELTAGGCANPSIAAGAAPTALTSGGAVDTTLIPAANIPVSAIAAAASSALSGIDLGSSAVTGSPLRSVPLRSVPLRSVGFPPVLLSTTPRTDGKSWASLLVGTPLDGVPAQNVTLQQVLDLAEQRATDGVTPRYPQLDGLTLASIDISASPLRSVSIASIALGATPLRSVVFTTTPEPGPFATYCNAIAVPGGFACSGAAGDAPLIAAELAGIRLRSVPLRSVPLRSVDLSASPLRSVPLRSVDLSVSPLRSVPLRSVLIAGSPLRSVPLRSVPLRSVDLDASPLRSVPLRSVSNASSIVNCTIVNCTAAATNADTLQTAADANAILPTANAGLLFDGLDAATAGPFILADLRAYADAAAREITIGDIQAFVPLTLTLADVLIALVPRASLPWESIPLDDLALGSLGAGASVPTTGTFTLFNNRPIASTALVFSVDSGSGIVAGSIDGTPVAAITRRADGTFAVAVPASLGAGPHSYAFAVGVTHVGPANVGVRVVDEIDGGQAGVVVSAVTGPISEGSSARSPLNGGSLMLGWLSGTPGEVDNYDINVPIVPGAITTVTLSHLGADGDLLGYNPTVRPPVSSRGFRNAGLQSPPAESTDPELAPAVPAIDPQTVQDLPVDGAVPNGLATVSAKRGVADEKIEFVTKAGDSGVYRVAVAGYNGAKANEPYLITVRQQIPAGSGACPARPAPTAAASSASPAIATDRKTLFIMNEQRLRSQYGDAAVTSMVTKLTTLAARPEVVGAIVRVDSDPTVRTAYANWDATPCDAQRANNVVGAINTLVDAKLGTPRVAVASMVLIGSDEMLPMARLSDNTKVENESQYAADLTNTTNGATPLSASLSGRNLLTDDAYGDFDPIAWRDTALYIPDVALGRLVETPAEMEKSIDPYLANQRLAATSALVAGYDFLSDGSVAVDNALTSVIPAAAHTTRINDTWTRSDIESVLYPTGASPMVVALNAHFDHYEALPAAGNTTNDRTDLITTQAVVTRPGRLQGRLVFSIGCHSGLNVPDAYLGAGAGDRAKDWAQALVNDGAVFIGNTGYGYGDRATIAFSERLQQLFAQRLDGHYTAGAALAAAKQEYFATLGAYSDYDHKAIMESTFYGLPFFGYGPDNGPPTPLPKLTTSPDPATGNIPASPVTFGPTFQTVATSNGSFLTADGQNPQVVEGMPIEPRVDRDVTATNPNLVAHGALITSASSIDSAGFAAAFGRPVVDLAANEPAKPSVDAAFPSKLQNIGAYTAPDGPRQRLAMIPGQFVGDGGTPGVGLQRRFTNLGVTVLYAAVSVTDFTAPTFQSVNAAAAGGTVTFTADVSDANNIVRVLALYRDGATWRSLDLTTTSTSGIRRFAGTGAASAGAIDYFLQAVDAAGNVAVSSNKATLFQSGGGAPNMAPVVNAGPNKITPANAAVTVSGSFADADSTSWTGSVTSGGPGAAPVPLTIAGSTYSASLTYATPGTYTASVQVCDNGGKCGSATFTVIVTAPPPTFSVAADMGVAGLQTIGFQPVVLSGNSKAQVAFITGSFVNAPAGTPTVTMRWTSGGPFLPVLKVSGTSFSAVNLYPVAGNNTATVKVCVGTTCVTDDVTVVTGVTSTALTPTLTCVADRGTTTTPRYLARYGYQNTATVPVYQPTLSRLTATLLTGASVSPAISLVLQRLSDNKFATTPIDRGQPQVFQPGTQSNAFETAFASGTQTWSLNGKTAAASTSSTRC